jgi:hypothetical protein
MKRGMKNSISISFPVFLSSASLWVSVKSDLCLLSPNIEAIMNGKLMERDDALVMIRSIQLKTIKHTPKANWKNLLYF